MKTLIFTAEGAYARFRCSYTTTSALTYSFMHPIAIKGMSGAIKGIDYSKLYEYTKNMKVGIQVLKPIYKDIQSFNLVPQSGGNGAANFQSRIEFLRNVKYRIFVSDIDEKLSDIAKTLISREYQFTPYLGCSEHVAKLKYEDIKETCLEEKVINGTVDTAIHKEFIVRNDDEDFSICIDRVPVENNEIREYTKYINVAFSSEKPLDIANCDIYKVGDYNVFFL